MRDCRSAFLAAALAAALLTLPPAQAAEEQQPASGAWDFMRTQLYGQRDIGVAGDAFMQIEVPANTPDPAATPVSVRFGDAGRGHIKSLRVIVDNNPSPVVSTFAFEPASPIDQIDLRVRVDRYTSIRAVAETADGTLQMRSRWVKASGGCSAPPGLATAGATGEIRFRPSADARSLQVSIRHPNNSGFQIDPRSGNAIPAHFVSHLVLKSGDRALLTAEMGISISENPTLRIASPQPLPAPITVEALDSAQARYSATWQGLGAVAGGSP